MSHDLLPRRSPSPPVKELQYIFKTTKLKHELHATTLPCLKSSGFARAITIILIPKSSSYNFSSERKTSKHCLALLLFKPKMIYAKFIIETIERGKLFPTQGIFTHNVGVPGKRKSN